MIFDDIRNYLGQQNFALTATNTRELCVLRNQANGRAVFVVIIDNTMYRVLGTSQVASIQSQLENMTFNSTGFNGCDVLFLVITNDLSRDSALAKVEGCRVWLINSATQQLIVYEDQAYDFYGMRAGLEASVAPKTRENIFGTYTVNSGQDSGRAAQQGQARKPVNISRVPYVSIALIAVNVIWYIILAAFGNTTDSRYMVAAGGNVGHLVFQELQIWRLFTSMFMHFGIMHLFSNMLYLGFMGVNLEQAIGHLKYFLIYMLSGLGASVVSAAYYYLTDTYTVSAGASGAIYGIIGTFIYLMVRNRAQWRSGYFFMRIGIALLFVFYSTFINPTVDGAAHVGGFVIGFILSFLFLRKRS